jgi:hypothetical protein
MTTAKSLSPKQVQQVFGVSHMTVFSWRQGNSKVTPLPCVTKPRVKGGKAHSVTITPAALSSWAKKNGIPIVVDPSTLLADPDVKPGPKPRVADPEPKVAVKTERKAKPKAKAT